VSRELAIALRLDRDVRLRGGQETIELPEGFVVRHAGLPDIHYLNAVLLRPPLAEHLDASAIAAIAEQWLGHLQHRYVVLDDGEAGGRLAPELMERGWERRRTLFMVYRGEPGRLPDDPRARAVSEAELRALQLANFGGGRFCPLRARGPGAAARRGAGVAARGDHRARVRRGRGWGAAVDGHAVPGPRRRGTSRRDGGGGRHVRLPPRARAVVGRAVRAALSWGADLVTIPADADDWPQLLYAKLGFEPVGIEVAFTLRGVPDS
jgi:hypothetical protein